MTKLRKANTLESAVLNNIAVLGIDGAARAVGKSEPLVRKWSDPDSETVINLKQAAVLDIAAMEAGGKPEITIFLAQHIEASQRQMKEKSHSASK